MNKSDIIKFNTFANSSGWACIIALGLFCLLFPVWYSNETTAESSKNALEAMGLFGFIVITTGASFVTLKFITGWAAIRNIAGEQKNQYNKSDDKPAESQDVST